MCTLTSCGIKLEERAVLKHLTSNNVPDHPSQLVCKPNRSFWDAVASLIYHITKSLDTFSISVRYFLVNFFAFDAVSRSSLELFSCSKRLSVWLSNYFSNRTQFTRLVEDISTPVVSSPAQISRCRCSISFYSWKGRCTQICRQLHIHNFFYSCWFTSTFVKMF